MKKTLLIIFIIFLSASTACGYSEGDFQIWHTESQDVTLCKGAKASFEQEFRYWEDSSELHYQHYDFGLVLSLSEYLDLGLFYRQVYERRRNHSKFMPEEVPNINATVKFDLPGVNVEDRNRFEYRHFSWQGDNCRYRNKVTLKTIRKFTRFGIYPFAANEIFVRFDDSVVFNQNRFSAGLGISPIKNIRGEVYYMRKSDRIRNKWTDANILGLKLKLTF